MERRRSRIGWARYEYQEGQGEVRSKEMEPTGRGGGSECEEDEAEGGNKAGHHP